MDLRTNQSGRYSERRGKEILSKSRGQRLYGPCHGTGMIEVEAPWMETTSDYPLEENMTFQADTFISGPTFGCRWEKGIAVKKDGYESYTDYLKKGIIELEV